LRVGSVDVNSTGESVNVVPITIADDQSDSSIRVETLSRTEVRCVGNTPVVNYESQEEDHTEKPLSSNNNFQEDVTARKSTRTKKIHPP